MPENKPHSPKELTYIAKVWYAAAIVAFVAILVLVARVAFSVLLMALAGCLISVYFHGLGDIIQRRTNLRRSLCMLISIGGSFIIVGFLLWFMGTKIQNQVAHLIDTLPHTISTAKLKLAESPLGRKVLEYFNGDNSDKLYATASQFFNTGFGVLGDMYIILFLGIFFTASPVLYESGMIMLVPPAHKAVAKNIITRGSKALKGWLKGTMVAMVLIALMIPIGLVFMHVPLALVLGLLTAILVIVPNFGSFVSMIPAVLLALTISTNTAIVVAIFYIVVHTLVGNIIMPVIQRKMIDLPPALTIVGQLLMGTLGGVLGIIMAIPVLALVMIMVDELYVKKINSGEGVDEKLAQQH